jgi:hypothetical protein
LRERQSSKPKEPLVELVTELLTTLGLRARCLLSSQGIATAEAFLSINPNTLANSLMEWRKRCDSSDEYSFRTAQKCISTWKAKLRERQSSKPKEPLVELDAELYTETAMGESMEDDNASNDYLSHHREDFKGLQPRNESTEQQPDSKRKRIQEVYLAATVSSERAID